MGDSSRDEMGVVGDPCLHTFTIGSLDTTQHIISISNDITKMAIYL